MIRKEQEAWFSLGANLVVFGLQSLEVPSFYRKWIYNLFQLSNDKCSCKIEKPIKQNHGIGRINGGRLASKDTISCTQSC